MRAEFCKQDCETWIHEDFVQVMAAMWLCPGYKSVDLANQQLSKDITFSITVDYGAITTAPGYIHTCEHRISLLPTSPPNRANVSGAPSQDEETVRDDE
ncbi:hypothetical protein Y032_0003g1319 [Ancylostoma ceylanicum]|uniref:Uncharacterized protein n=1 Tax=Ancylostoma ceylanicum TaxID=53326 RepID=A0A016VYU8_9BILA|nr:hypothetical protein Y032_0003g1319 [Ancylostoma ceylanicum]